MSAGRRRSVVITGVSNLDKEFIELIYTNTIKSGGGEIEDIEMTRDGRAVIKFTSSDGML